MADIFISYAKKDRGKVEPLANALADQGWTVWWDRTIPGGKIWDEVIEEELDAAKCVIVVWSNISVSSRWVRAEAEEGLRRNILVPVSIEDIKIPLLFRPIQAVRLIHWQQDSNHPQFEKLISDLSPILGPSPLKVRETEQKRAEDERIRVQEEENKFREEERKRIEVARKAEEELKQKEAKAKRRADEGQRRKEKEELKLKTEEERKHKEIKTEIKPVKVKSPEPEPDIKAPTEPKFSEPRKTNNLLKLGVLAGVAVLLIVGIWWWVFQQQVKEVRQEIEKLNRQALKLENAVSKLDKPEQIEELYRQRDTLSRQAEALGEQATKVGLESQLAELQHRLNQVQIQLDNKEKEFIAARKGSIFVESFPENAMVRILNIDQGYRQGMELEPGSYHVEVAAEGYETERRWIDLVAGHEEPFRFELAKIKDAELTSPEKTIANNIGMKFMLIPAGSLTMGSRLSSGEVTRRYGGKAEWYKDEQPPHPVEITRPFYLQTTEVSQAQWKRIMGNNPSRFKDCGDDCPVEKVSWNDAQKFIEELNQMEGINKYRLPTEAEWEYACRAKTETAYSFGDEVDKLGEYAWYGDNSGGKTKPVGRKKPNDWGLYDMHGNVWEWVQDRYGDYPTGPILDPKGPDKGEYRVLRGGSWSHFARILRSAYRGSNFPDDRSDGDGFRVARDF